MLLMRRTQTPLLVCMSNCRQKIRFCLPFYSSSKGGFNQQPIHSMFTLAAAFDFLEESLSFNTKVLESVRKNVESCHQAVIATIFLFTILQVICSFFTERPFGQRDKAKKYSK